MRHTVVRGDARRLPLPDRSVHTCVTSPPYFGLRDYQTEGQIGLEQTPEQFVAALVEVFREVRRVLRDDGTLWVNMGDSYANDAKWGGKTGGKHVKALHGTAVGRMKRKTGLKEKDLIGIPWMLAFALRDDGWYLRSDCIWSKPSPMPESVTDRPSKSHEYLFLLSKQARYFYDNVAIMEPHAAKSLTHRGNGVCGKVGAQDALGKIASGNWSGVPRINNPAGANKRSVWTVSSKSFKGAHFATFPQKLIIPCIRAGTSEKGCCRKCGAPWRRVVSKKRVATRPGTDSKVNRASSHEDSPYNGHGGMIVGNRDPQRHTTEVHTIGWESSCTCLEARHPVPCTVLDPFGGAATTSVTAALLGRSSVVTELNPEYALMGRNRIDASLLELARPHKPRLTRKPRPPRAGQGLLFP